MLDTAYNTFVSRYKKYENLRKLGLLETVRIAYFSESQYHTLVAGLSKSILDERTRNAI